MNLIKKLLIIFLGFPVIMNAQKKEKYFSLTTGYSSPDGKIRLVRGTRKIVTTDATAGWTAEISAGMQIKKGIALELSYQYASYRYQNNSAFTNGIYVPNDLKLPYSELMGSLQYTFFQKRGLVLNAGIHIGYTFLKRQLNVEGEAELPQNLDTINRSTIVFDAVNFPGAGLGLKCIFPITRTRLFVVSKLKYTLSNLKAIRRNDPDGDDGYDIDTYLGPISGLLGIGIKL